METRGWNKTTKTGWLKEGGVWVQYRGGKRTGRTEKKGSDTNLVGKFVSNQKKFWSSNPRKDKLKVQQQREKAGFPDKSVLDKGNVNYGKMSHKWQSPSNLKKLYIKDTTSETGPFGGKNQWKESNTFADSLKRAEELKEKGVDITKSKSKSKSKKNGNKFPGGKEGYTKFEKSGARQSSARNSIARQQYLKKKRDKLKAGK